MSYNLLKGKRGIIFGALNDKSIAWKAKRKQERSKIDTLTSQLKGTTLFSLALGADSPCPD